MSTIAGWTGAGFVDENSTQARTLGGLFFWDVARQHLNSAFDAMREDLNVQLARDDFARAVAHRELARIWRAAALTLVELRLPKVRKKPGGTWGRALTLNPGKKKTQRTSRVFKVKKMRKVGARDRGGRIRSHHKGTYSTSVAPRRGRPRKYFDGVQIKAAARRRAVKSYLKTTLPKRTANGKVRLVKHWRPKDEREKVKKIREKERAVRRELRLELKGAKLGRKLIRWVGGKLGASAAVVKEDKRHNHHPEYDYARPRLRLRRSVKAAARGKKRFPNTKKKRVASRVLRTVTKARQEFLSRGRKIKRMAKMRAGLKRWREDFQREFRKKMGYTPRSFTQIRKRKRKVEKK